MEEYLKKYKVTITTKGPVYIGSGKNIGKKEYYIDNKNNKIWIFDMKKFFEGISKLGLDKKYQDYLFNKDSKNLNSFVAENNIKNSLEKWVSYKIDFSDLVKGNNNEVRNKNINTFIKQRENENYIPGSSLKGAIRTALLTADLIENKEKYNDIREDEKVYECANKIEKICFNILEKDKDDKSNSTNDIMSCIRVSDSDPIEKDRMMVTKRKEFKAARKDFDSSEEQENSLSVFYECIKPGTTITTYLTIDTSKQDKIDIDKIKKAISIYAEKYYTNYSSTFSCADRLKKNTLILGGYSGFASKTINYALFDGDKKKAVMMNGNIFNNAGRAIKKHKHREDYKRYGISPRTYKFANVSGKNLGVGLVELKFEEE